jgi:hypothetical protein
LQVSFGGGNDRRWKKDCGRLVLVLTGRGMRVSCVFSCLLYVWLASREELQNWFRICVCVCVCVCVGDLDEGESVCVCVCVCVGDLDEGERSRFFFFFCLPFLGFWNAWVWANDFLAFSFCFWLMLFSFCVWDFFHYL